MKGKILQKFIATILVFCMTAVNFILVGTNAVYAISRTSVNIENGNIIFDAYFKDESSKIYSKTGEITSGEKLYLSLEVKSGVIENSKVKIENANFKLDSQNAKNKYIKSINEATNEIELNRISYGNSIEIELPILFEKTDNISVDYFSRENSIILSGKYKNTSENGKDINAKINTSLTWSNKVHTDYNTSIEKFVKENNKLLIEQKVTSSVENNVLPKTKETIKNVVPKINDKLPTKINVLFNGNKIDENKINNGYNLNEGTLEFTQDFVTDNKISWKTGTDTYSIIYIYELETDNITNSIEVKPEIETEIYGYEGKLTGKPGASITRNSNKGTVTSITAEPDKNDIYKGYMYSNSEETKYNETYKVEISNKDNINNINVEFVEDNFKTQDGNSISTNGKTAYKQIAIDKGNMQSILGQDGTISIENTNGTIQSIDKNTQANDQGKIVIELDTNNIKIVTSKPVQEGTLEINATKAIKGDAGYNKDILKTINAIETKVQVKTDNSEDLSEATISKELKETTTEATLEMNNENRGNILSAVDKNSVEFVATLKTGTMDADLYKEPTIKILLPQEVENIKINSVSELYAGNELEVEKYDVGDCGDGRKTIEVKLKGEQIKYDNKLSDGIKVTVNANIGLNELAASKDSKIEMIYTNENGNDKSYSTGIDIKIQSRDGLILRNILTVGDNTKKTFNEEVLSQLLELENIPKTANENITIVNNYGQEINNVSIIGRLPEKGVEEKVFETTLKNTFSANTKINTTANDIEILYSEEANANADSNSWTQDSSNAKSYKIILKESKLAVGETLDINYEMALPETINYNESIFHKIDISYTYEGQTLNKTAAMKLYTEVKTAEEAQKDSEGVKESVNGLDIKVTAISAGKELKDSDSVYEGQIIKYIITLKNNTENELNNIKIVSNHENANVFDEEIHDEPFSGDTDIIKKYVYIREIEGKSQKETSVDTLKPNEEKTNTYQIRVKEDVSNINNKIDIKINDKSEKTIETSNKVQEGELKLTILNNQNIGNSILKGQEVPNAVSVKNISNNTLKDINLVINIPEELTFVKVDEMNLENDKFTILDQNGRNVSLRINQLNSGETIDLDVRTKADKDVAEKSVVLQAYATVNNKTYFSNEVDMTIKQTEESKLTINNEGTLKTEEVANGENVTFVTTIKNVGDNEIKSLTISDTIPSGIEVQKAFIEKNGENIDVKFDENNILEEALSDIKPEEEIKLNVEVKVSTDKYNEPTISNKVKVTADGKEYESNEVTYKMKDYIDDSKTDENEEGETIYDEEGEKIKEEQGNNSEDDATVKTVNSISGLVWLDENKNGIRENQEKMLSGIEVSIANTETGKYVTDKDGNKIVVTTDENGKYTFNNIETGKYMVIFKYDNIKYRNTEYRANGATDSTNSDVITSKVSINEDNVKYAVTDTLNIVDEGLENIDAGFIENEIFDLTLNKYISKVTVQNNNGTKVKEYNNEQLAKVEIDAKQIAGSTVLMEFSIQVTNEGELPGYASEIVDYIPKDLQFPSEINKDWYSSTDGNLHSTALSKELINPGETKTLTLTLVKTMTSNNAGMTSNTAEIAKSSNDLSIPDKDSTSGNNAQGEDDISTAEVIVSIRTGLAITISIITVIIALAVAGIIIYTMKRKESKNAK